MDAPISLSEGAAFSAWCMGHRRGSPWSQLISHTIQYPKYPHKSVEQLSVPVGATDSQP